jgi:hypothetical protein
VTTPSDQDQDFAARRASARRTAWVVAGLAVLVYVVFLTLNALAR